MPDPATHHPPADDLRAYGRGLLPVAGAAAVEEHLAGCDICCRILECASVDKFLDRLRALRTPAEAPSACPEGRYVAVQLHAAGGLGEVHVAEDAELGRRVALKRIRPARADDPDSRRRFLREAEVTARLEHPGVVPVYGLVHDADGRPAYAMRLVAGESLHQAVRSFHAADRPGRDPGERRLALRGLLARFVAVCQTVAYAHSRGVVHRDLKPANVMLGPYGETLVVDWGLAKVSVGGQWSVVREEEGVAEAPSLATDDWPLTTAGVVGTPAFMSPEQAAGRHAEVGPASDVYGLGATLYTVLAGRPPFDGVEATMLTAAGRGPPTPPRQLNPSVPAALEAVCVRAMAERPEDRYGSAAELGAEVEHWLAGEPVRAHPEHWPARAARWARRHRVATGALAAGLFVAALLGGAGGAWLGREAAERREERTRMEAKDADAVRIAFGELPDLVRAWRFREAKALLNQTALGLSAFAPPEARDRLEQALTDLRLAERLDAVRIETIQNTAVVGWKVDTTAAAAIAYREAFERHGLDCLGGEVEALGARIAASPVRDALLAGLDGWAGGERDDGQRERLTRIARAADPHPWRDQFRDFVARGNLAAGRELAKQADIERLSPTVLGFLAATLGSQTPEAERLLRRAQALHPADFWLNFQLAFAIMRKNDRASAAEAIGYYRACLAARETVVVYLNLGAALRNLGDRVGQEAACRRAVELDPSSAWAHAFLGHSLYDRGDLAGAAATYRCALKLHPDLAWANAGLGDVLTKQGDLTGATAAYRRAVDLSPKSAVPQVKLAGALHSLGDLAGAAAASRRAIELDPKNVQAHTRLGFVLEALGDLSGAADALGRVTDLDPKSPIAHFNLATVLFKRGDWAGAAAASRRAIELDPKDASAHVSLGGALYRQGNLVEAIAAERRATELDPKNVNAHTNHGMMLLRHGDLAGAAAACRRAIELDPKNSRALTNLGVALDRLGDLTGAAAAFRRVTELDPGNATAHSNLGNVLTGRGDLEGAITAYRRAVELVPKDAHAHLRLAYVLMRHGRFADAKAPAQRALELLPPGQPVRERATAQLERCELMLRLESKLPAVLRGEACPADAAEQIALAELAAATKRYAAAARLYGDLPQQDPEAADDFRRYNAACAAARAGCGPGRDDPAPDAAERARWRRQALDWLQADLKVQVARLAAADPKAKVAARQALRHWQSDLDLAGVRDAADLAVLPADERDKWRRFWKDVDETLGANRK